MDCQKWRLDKYLSSQENLSRTQAAACIRQGRVTLDGEVCRDGAVKFCPDTAQVTLDGRLLNYRRFVYLMLNKPSGILCVSRDPSRETVVDLAPEEFRRRSLFPAGRLDKDTEGLVLLTDDGDYAHRLLAPKNKIPKVYHAVLDGPILPEHIAQFAQGAVLADGTPCLPAQLRVLQQGGNPLAEVTIYEGKYHQIKRMFGVAGLGVMWLKRLSIGGLRLDETLAKGECRLLTEEEVKAALYGDGQAFSALETKRV